MGAIVCISLVHDCIIRLFSFVHLWLFYLSLGEWGYAIPTFLILDSKMGLIVCTLLVHDGIRLFLFVHLWLFYLSTGRGAGDMLSPPFSILDSKIGSIDCISLVHDCILLVHDCISLVHDCIRLFSFVHLLLFYLFLKGLDLQPLLCFEHKESNIMYDVSFITAKLNISRKHLNIIHW